MAAARRRSTRSSPRRVSLRMMLLGQIPAYHSQYLCQLATLRQLRAGSAPLSKPRRAPVSLRFLCPRQLQRQTRRPYLLPLLLLRRHSLQRLGRTRCNLRRPRNRAKRTFLRITMINNSDLLTNGARAHHLPIPPPLSISHHVSAPLRVPLFPQGQYLALQYPVPRIRRNLH